MIKHYCEKCGKEVRKWMVCTVETDTDLSVEDTVSAVEIDNMRDLISEYEICYDCLSMFLNSMHAKPQPRFYHISLRDLNSRSALTLKRRLKYRDSAVPRPYSHGDEPFEEIER